METSLPPLPSPTPSRAHFINFWFILPLFLLHLCKWANAYTFSYISLFCMSIFFFNTELKTLFRVFQQSQMSPTFHFIGVWSCTVWKRRQNLNFSVWLGHQLNAFSWLRFASRIANDLSSHILARCPGRADNATWWNSCCLEVEG